MLHKACQIHGNIFSENSAAAAGISNLRRKQCTEGRIRTQIIFFPVFCAFTNRHPVSHLPGSVRSLAVAVLPYIINILRKILKSFLLFKFF